jgi:nucleoside-diphosphate-sugar epimerase
MSKSADAVKIKYTTSLPTSLIINGLGVFGYELAKTLVDQGGYVIIIDDLSQEWQREGFLELKNTALVDFSGVHEVVEEIRRLDYVFYLNHNPLDNGQKMTSSDFLAASSYLKEVLDLSVQFEALFLLTNSIRSHKNLIETERNNLLKPMADGSYSAFTELEFIRYSENLVLEYRNVHNLEAKVVRMGEILGEGVVLSTDSNVGRLLIQVLAGEKLYIQGDGLQVEYYVHLLDAIYGVIKTQFSKELIEPIYSIAYPEPITQLSLAYKIQELVPGADEIKFVDENSRIINVHQRIYQAAPNLYKFGWRPKVDLESALKQTYEFTKSLLEIYTQQNQAAIDNESHEQMLARQLIGNKPSLFEDVFPDDSPLPDKDLTPLARLIEERRAQEFKDKKGLNAGVQKLELSRQRLPMARRLRIGITRRWDLFKSNFRFLDKLTITEFITYTFLVFMFVFIYLNVFAPVIGIARDLFLIKGNLNQLSHYQSTQQWGQFNKESKSLMANVDSFNKVVEGADLLFNAIRGEDMRQELLSTAQSLQFKAQGFESTSHALIDLDKYLNERNTELALRPTNSSILSVANLNLDENYKASITEIAATAQNGQSSLSDGNRVYAARKTSYLPSFLRTTLADIWQDTDNYDSLVTNTSSAIEYYRQIGKDKFNLGILIQDSQRLNYSGGKISAIGIVQYKNGKIISVRLQSVDNTDLKTPQLNSAEVDEYTKLTGTNPQDNTSLVSVLDGLLTEKSVEDVSLRAIGQTFSENVDDVERVNLTSLEDLLGTYGDVVINGQTFNSANYSQTLDVLAAGSLRTRNIIITNLFGELFKRHWTATTLDSYSKAELIVKLAHTNKLDFAGGLDSLNSTGQESKNPNVFIAAMIDPKVDFKSLPALDVALNSKLADRITNDLSINTYNLAQLSAVVVCLTPEASRAQISNVNLTQIESFALGEDNCYMIKSPGQSNIGINYSVPFDLGTFDYIIKAAPGILMRYDVEVDTAGFPLQKAVPAANQSLNSLFYTSQAYAEFKFSLKFNTNEQY